MSQLSKERQKEEFSTFVTLNIPELQSRHAVDLQAPIWCNSQTQHSTIEVFLSFLEPHFSEFFKAS